MATITTWSTTMAQQKKNNNNKNNNNKNNNNKNNNRNNNNKNYKRSFVMEVSHIV